MTTMTERADMLPCDKPGCTRHALRVVGNTVQVRLRHDGEWHVTTIPLTDLLRLATGALDKHEAAVSQ